VSAEPIDDGGPVHPCQLIDSLPTTGEQVVREQWFGISYRADVAKECLAALIGRPELDCCPEDSLADTAIRLTDALIRRLKGGAA